MITTRDLAWTAGFMDGEGHFNFQYTPVATAAQNDRELLDRLRGLYGGTVRWDARPKQRNGGIHSWTVCGQVAAGLMMTLFPMLSQKRRAQIRASLGAWRAKGRRIGEGRTRTHCSRGHLYDAVRSRRGRPPSRVCRQCAAMMQRAYRKTRALAG
jgi:hypothetical protein